MVLEPALTYTIEDFIASKLSDEMTYHRFSIIEKSGDLQLLDHNIIEDYRDELNSLAFDYTFTLEEYNRYKYAPDLLAHDIYKSTQLDFIILMINGMIDPKEFNVRKIKLIYPSNLKAFISAVYNAEEGYISQNRADNNMKNF